MKLPVIPHNYTFVVLRVISGIIFISHGPAKLFYWSIPDFSGFLNAKGHVMGLPLAWIITIGEIVIGVCLTMGFKVWYCVIFHLLVIIPGIYLVYLHNGWFTVDHGTGGVEYSLLLVAMLLFLYSKGDKRIE